MNLLLITTMMIHYSSHHVLTAIAIIKCDLFVIIILITMVQTTLEYSPLLTNT